MKKIFLAVFALGFSACATGEPQPMQGKAGVRAGDCCAKEKTPATGCCKEGAEADAPQDSMRGASQTVAKEFLKPGDTRTFSLEYVAKIVDIPQGARQLRVWLPVPQDSTVQTITDLSFSKEPKIATEPKYGNKIAYWELENPGTSVEITMKFTCQRREIKMDLDALKTDGSDPADSFDVFRKADALVLVDDEIRKLSDGLCKDRKTTLEKANAIYQYVLEKMSYDKSHQGWGRGSTKHACEVGKGNCTDFHALFNSLCRSQGIASGFEIGLYLPYENKTKGEKLGGYHCWAYFRVPGKSWVPVDCSEADRFPERATYFFGSHTSNRVGLSTGRDLTLEPKQAGEPLNYFLNPYAEADGKPVKTDKIWAFKDLD